MRWRHESIHGFEMEDKWARDFLVQQSKDKDNDIEFYDFSVKDPFDAKWKTECVKRIAMTKGTIILVGPTTSEFGCGPLGDC